MQAVTALKTLSHSYVQFIVSFIVTDTDRNLLLARSAYSALRGRGRIGFQAHQAWRNTTRAWSDASICHFAGENHPSFRGFKITRPEVVGFITV